MSIKCQSIKNYTSDFVNALNILNNDNNNEKSQDVIGYSANAISILLFGLGYTMQEVNKAIINVMSNQFLNNIKHNNNSHKILSISINSKAFSKKIQKDKQFKLSFKDNFLIWIQKQIQNKLGNPLATFADLHKQSKKQAEFKDTSLAGLDIETGDIQIFNYKNTPELPLAIAARICMSCYTSFPIVEVIDLTTKRKSTYIDGGLILQHLYFC